MSCCLILRVVCSVVCWYVLLCYTMLNYGTVRCGVLCYVLLRYVLSCYVLIVILCYGSAYFCCAGGSDYAVCSFDRPSLVLRCMMLCCASCGMSCFVMSCYAISCYAMSC